MSNEKKIIKSAREADEFLDSSIRYHRRRLVDSIKTLENNIIDMTNEFKSSNGSLMGPRVNMKQAQKMHAKLTSLFDETYGAEARQVVSGFSKSANYIKKNFKSLDVAMDFTSVDKDMIKVLKKNTWRNFNQFGLQAQERLVDTMYNSITSKQPFSQMVNHFRGILSGFEDVRGRSMANYADLYAHDSIMDFHNAVHLKKADDLGFDHFLYYGSAMTTTRDFCFRRMGKVFSKKEIESWVHGWSGKSGPAMTNRGGYRCRHHWRPVRKNWIKDKKKFEDSLRIEQGLPAEIAVKPSDALPAEVKAKMSPRQLTAYDNYVPSDLKSRTIAEAAEREISKGLVDSHHIIGKRPFDLFLDNEFIECKTFVTGRGQIRIRPNSMRKKKAFMKKYNVRGHIVAKDMRKGSPTYGKIFHRAELGDWTPHTMTEVKDYDHLKRILKKGTRKDIVPELAFKKVPKSKTIQQAEEYARKKLGIKEVGYGGVGKVPSDLLNGYMRGSINKLGVKPTRVLFDDAIFVGRNKRVAALAMEDGSLYLNRKYLGTVEKMITTTKNQFRLGQFSTDSVGHVINHEFGHLKYFHIGGTEATAGKKLTKQMIHSLKDIGPENLPRYVSKYALKNQGEFFAEMIAKQLNGESLHPVCRKIMFDIERGVRRKGIQKVRKMVEDRGLAAKLKKEAIEKAKLKIPEYKITDAFSKYKGSDPESNAMALNWALREGDKLTSIQRGVVSKMDDAFRHAPKAGKGEVVYRGYGGNLPKDLRVGELFQDKAFVSTSKSFDIAEDFSTLVEDKGYVFKIKIPKGARRVDMDQFADEWDIATTIGQEKEILLPRGSYFDIKSIKGNIVEMEYVGEGSGWSLGRNKVISLKKLIKEEEAILKTRGLAAEIIEEKVKKKVVKKAIKKIPKKIVAKSIESLDTREIIKKSSKGELPKVSKKQVNETLKMIERLIISGGPDSIVNDFSEEGNIEALSLLKATIRKYKKLKLYRGIGLIPGKAKAILNKKQIEVLNGLKTGDDLPDFMSKAFNDYSSYTKKKSVSKYYASGKMSIIVEAEVIPENILVDLENLQDVLKKSGHYDAIGNDYLKDSIGYFKTDREVIVKEPIKSKIIEIKGYL